MHSKVDLLTILVLTVPTIPTPDFGILVLLTSKFLMFAINKEESTWRDVVFLAQNLNFGALSTQNFVLF